ncbi:VCBS domain-containing protein [Pseudomonas sp. H9]|uniref:VCBS domain-containing protein n=1 Tax=Pseudomonas sp. H9 TaxID=483968 RepID=UPI00105793AC|nr:VCBS domain-containing protein [Pseudomonas sp. H9]TDF83792.1 hypothetical protein E1573_08525 [Pseudomonas sp. H9]
MTDHTLPPRGAPKDAAQSAQGAEAAAENLRAREHNFGHDPLPDEQSPLGWTSPLEGSRLAPIDQGEAHGHGPAHQSGPLAAGQGASAALPVNTDTGPVPVEAAAPGAPGFFRDEASGHWVPPDSLRDMLLVDAARLHFTPSATAITGSARAHGAGNAIGISTSAAKPEYVVPTLQVVGDELGITLEDRALEASGQLLASGGLPGAALIWEVQSPDSPLGMMRVDGQGHWHYQLDNASSAVQSLAAGQQVVEQFLVRISDGVNVPTHAVIRVVVVGTNDQPQICATSVLDGTVSEDLINTVSGTLQASDVDQGAQLSWAGDALQGLYGHLELDSASGSWRYHLNNALPAVQALGVGQSLQETFNVRVTDEHGASAISQITITLQGTNDVPVISQASALHASEDGAVVHGQLNASDVDQGDRLTFATQATLPGFILNADGSYRFDPSQADFQHLAEGATQQWSVPITVSDNHGGSATLDLTIILTGTNDLPVMSVLTPREVHEGDAPISAIAMASDIDDGDVLTFSSASVVEGFSIDPDGTYHFDPTNPAYQHLAEGARQTLTITLIVTDNHGASATQNLIITLIGTNQGAIITGVDSGSVTEDHISAATRLLETAGRLSISDVDDNQSSFVAHDAGNPLQGRYGALTLDADGNWQYHADNDQLAIQQLAQGSSVTDSFTVTSLDGTSHQIVITLHGINDAPLISAVSVIAGGVIEDAPLQFTSGQLLASDIDLGASLSWSLGSTLGLYGTLAIDAASGAWIYRLDNALATTQSLAAGQQVTEQFVATVSDGLGGTAQQWITITITGSNDLPVISGSNSGAVVEDTLLTASGTLTASDVDTGDTLGWSVVNGSGAYGTLVIDASSGLWTYSLDNARAATQALAAGQQAEERFVVQAIDSSGQPVTHTVTISVSGTNDLPMISGTRTGTVSEDAPVNSVSGTLIASDVDHADFSRWTIDGNVAGTYGVISLDPNSGRWVYTLDNSLQSTNSLRAGQTVTETFTVRATDLAGGFSTQTLTLTIIGSNDLPVISGSNSGAVVEDTLLTASGTLTASDVDTGDTLGWSVVNGSGAYGALVIDASSGLWTYSLDNARAATQALAAGQQAEERFVVQATDSSGQPVTHTVTISVSGTNDLPVISGTRTGTVSEDAPVNSVSGTLVASDVDHADFATWAITGNAIGNYGAISLDPSSGRWVYTLDNNLQSTDGLLAGQTVTETFTVRAIDRAGGSSTSSITITLVGSNDLPVISGTTTGAVTEDAPLNTAQGDLLAHDVDQGDSLVWSVGTSLGTYGSLSINPASGHWVYTLDNTRTATNALPSGAKVFDSFIVRATDSSGQPVSQVVTLQITGSNDLPVISGTKTGTLTEDASTTQISATLTATDPDTGDTLKWAESGDNTSVYGNFAFNTTTGRWTYTLDSTREATNALAKGEKVTEVFRVSATDSSGTPVSYTITITINGANDLPVISGSHTGEVIEDALANTIGGSLSHSDVDRGDSFNWSLDSGAGTYGTLSFNTSTGIWLYSLDNSRASTQALAEGKRHVEQFTVRAKDSSGIAVLQTISIDVLGSNDNPRISGTVQGSVVEDRNLYASGSLTFNDIDKGDTLGSWSVLAPQGVYGTLSINQNGVWSYNLDPLLSQSIRAGDTQLDTFIVRVSDNHGGYAEQLITLRVVGSNDGPAIDPGSPALSGNVIEDNAGFTQCEGHIASGDPDIGDVLSWRIYNALGSEYDGLYGSLSLDQDGHWVYTLDHSKADALAEGALATDEFLISVTDAAGARSNATIVVRITGTNDGPHIGGTSTGTVTEDSATRTGGQLNPGDVDVGDTATWEYVGNEAGQYGTFTLNANGSWSYQLDVGTAKVDALGIGDTAIETFRVKVTDGQGVTDFKDISVIIKGQNDAPLIKGNIIGTVQEDQLTSVTGKLVAYDADTGDHPTFQSHHYIGAYGDLVLDENGNWTYSLDNTSARVQALTPDDKITETFVVAAVDQHGARVYQEVTITVFGTNDAPVISGVTADTVIHHVAETASGRLVGADLDRLDSTFWSLPEGQGRYGELTLDDYGNWTYTLNTSDPDTQALRIGDQAIDSFLVQLTDKYGATVSSYINITVIGTQDRPLPGPGDGDTVLDPLAIAVIEDNQPSLSGQLDNLPGGVAFTWTITPGADPFGTLALGADGSWTYTLLNDAAHVQGLNQGQTVDEYFDVVGIGANGQHVYTRVTVNITGTNDEPTIEGVFSDTVVEDQDSQANGHLSVRDADINDTHLWTLQNPAGELGTLFLDANGDWTYTLDNSKAQYLNVDEHKDEVFTVVVTDSHGATATHTITITIHGTADGPRIDPVAVGTAIPGAQETLGGNVPVQDADADDTAAFSLLSDSHGRYGTLSIDADGNWSYLLDPSSTNAALKALAQGMQAQDIFIIQVRDSTGALCEQQITVTVQGINDTPVLAGITSGSVTDRSMIVVAGRALASDPDQSDLVNIAPYNETGRYGQFSIDANGNWRYMLDRSLEHYDEVMSLNPNESLKETFRIVATDSNGAQVMRDVVVTVNGANYLPEVDGDVLGVIKEDGPNTIQGQLTSTDIDHNDTTVWSPMYVAGTYGQFQMSADGTWRYQLKGDAPQVQALREGQVMSGNFIAYGVDHNGGEVVRSITIQVVGTDDPAIITGQVSGEATEDSDVLAGQLQVTGKLHISDVDTGEGIVVAQTVVGLYGTLNLFSDGNWRYLADNTQAAIQQLSEGDSLYDVFSLSTVGGTAYQISITLNGSNDLPQLAAITAQNAKEGDGLLVGQLIGSDIDASDTLTFSSNTVAGFTLSNDGSYSFDPNNTAYQYLAAGQTLKLTIPITANDGHGGTASQNLVITLTGTNDVPLFSAIAERFATEGAAPLTGQLIASDIDTSDSLTFSTASNIAGFNLNGNGSYSFDPSNAAYQYLAQDETLVLTIPVIVNDGHGGTASQNLVITLTGTNDLPLFSAITEQVVSEGGAPLIGQLNASDVDSSDSLTFSTTASIAGFFLDSDGRYSFDPGDDAYQHLAEGESTTLTIPITVSDNQGGSTTQDLLITLMGSETAGRMALSEDPHTLESMAIGESSSDSALSPYLAFTTFEGSAGSEPAEHNPVPAHDYLLSAGLDPAQLDFGALASAPIEPPDIATPSSLEPDPVHNPDQALAAAIDAGIEFAQIVPEQHHPLAS